MNPLPPNADELVSAYLDGEATPDEITIVESNPALLSRVDDLRAMSGQLGAPASVPEAQKEAHIAAALDAFDALFASPEMSSTATADGEGAAASGPSAPHLAAVPPVAPHDGRTEHAAPENAAPEHTTPVAESSTVHSLDTARERRRPRRFNTGVIAAAAAVMLLFVAAAALSFGRGNSSDDVASADTASSAELTSGEDAELDDNALSSLESAEPLAEQAAPEAARAMDEAEDEAFAAGSEADAMEEAAPVEAADADEAASDEAMADDEAMSDDDAMEDTVENDSEGGASDTAERLTTERYDLGTFESRTQLKTGLEDFNVSVDELLEQATEFEAGIIPSCRDEIPELADSAPDQVLAEAFLEDEGLIIAEIYVLTNADLTRDIYVVDRADCMLISVLEDQ